MLGIGEFSGMTGLSVKAFRHYDEKGVLIPTEVMSGPDIAATARVRCGLGC